MWPFAVTLQIPFLILLNHPHPTNPKKENSSQRGRKPYTQYWLNWDYKEMKEKCKCIYQLLRRNVTSSPTCKAVENKHEDFNETLPVIYYIMLVSKRADYFYFASLSVNMLMLARSSVLRSVCDLLPKTKEIIPIGHGNGNEWPFHLATDGRWRWNNG